MVSKGTKILASLTAALAAPSIACGVRAGIENANYNNSITEKQAIIEKYFESQENSKEAAEYYENGENPDYISDRETRITVRDKEKEIANEKNSSEALAITSLALGSCAIFSGGFAFSSLNNKEDEQSQ